MSHFMQGSCVDGWSCEAMLLAAPPMQGSMASSDANVSYCLYGVRVLKLQRLRTRSGEAKTGFSYFSKPTCNCNVTPRQAFYCQSFKWKATFCPKTTYDIEVIRKHILTGRPFVYASRTCNSLFVFASGYSVGVWRYHYHLGDNDPKTIFWPFVCFCPVLFNVFRLYTIPFITDNQFAALGASSHTFESIEVLLFFEPHCSCQSEIPWFLYSLHVGAKGST